MKSTIACSALLAAVLILPLGASAQTLYHEGMCDGTLVYQSAASTVFSPAGKIVPDYLWVRVLSGTGYVTMTSSSGPSGGFYFHTADLLLFPTANTYTLDFQGGTMQIAYGGASTGGSLAAVCGTGALGPVVILADAHYDVLMETSTTGVSAAVMTYSSVTPMTVQTLNYIWVTGLGSATTYNIPACSGSSCCSPLQKVFSVAKSGAGTFSVYQLGSSPSANFDYLVAGSAALSAVATADPTSGAPPLAVSFTGSASGGTSPYSWDWDFGDGSAHVTTQNPSHTYHSSGLFNPVLTVKDSAAHSATDSHLEIDTSVLVATATANPAAGNAPLTVAFGGSATGGHTPYTYAWKFGDGGTSTLASPAHTYSAAGTYAPVLTVTDADSTTASDSHLSIRVTPPGVLTAIAQADVTGGTVPLTVNFAGSATGGTAPYTYAWDFGDGAQSSAQNPVHTYASQGNFTATLTVHDAVGLGRPCRCRLRASPSTAMCRSPWRSRPRFPGARLPTPTHGTSVTGPPPPPSRTPPTRTRATGCTA